jgi:hypothetical protein
LEFGISLELGVWDLELPARVWCWKQKRRGWSPRLSKNQCASAPVIAWTASLRCI